MCTGKGKDRGTLGHDMSGNHCDFEYLAHWPDGENSECLTTEAGKGKSTRGKARHENNGHQGVHGMLTIMWVCRPGCMSLACWNPC